MCSNIVIGTITEQNRILLDTNYTISFQSILIIYTKQNSIGHIYT